MNNIYLSVIIPAYNEENRIGRTLEQILAFLRRQAYASEIIVVDDGSSDATQVVCRKILGDFPHHILVNPVNQGKGAAVKNGMLHAKGQFVLFADADLSTPIEEVNKLMKCLQEGYDLAIGSRALPQSQVEIHQNRIREMMGKIFNRLARLFAFRSIRDSQCGFKCFKREVAYDLFNRQKLAGFSFDAEIIYLAQQAGYKIYEVPVIWRNSPASRVRILKDSMQMFLDLLRIRWLHHNSYISRTEKLQARRIP